ncbi:MAG: acylneuraminate cytidylyltransferase family protein [candidate division WOR-3 bacterium]
MKNKLLCIIPARASSKRLKNKNIYPVLGKPLILYTIEEALKSGIFDKIVISTDSEEIEKLSLEKGVDVIKRPSKLSGDKAKTISAVFHVLKKLKEEFNYIFLLQPTSPLRDKNDILKAFDKIKRERADFLVSVTDFEKPFKWAIYKKNKFFDFYFSKKFRKKLFLPNGAIFIAKYKALLKEKTFYGKKLTIYYMPREKSIDIDTIYDLKMAEIILKLKNETERSNKR